MGFGVNRAFQKHKNSVNNDKRLARGVPFFSS
jgi:hypothetical protein